jgi:hypothetical protein
VTDEPKTYSGWKVGLAIVGATLLVFSLFNLLGLTTRHERRLPKPVVTSIRP